MTKYKINKIYDNKFEKLCTDIKEYFQDNEQTIHKARNELKIINFEGIDTIVKSFKIPNIVNKIAYSYLRDSKACKSYEYSLKIGEFTPNPIAYIEFFENKMLVNSYFISERFNYDFTIREPLLDDNFSNKLDILKAFARFTFDLHEKGIFHNDYSPGNILIKRDNDGFIFKIVDINRMKFGELNSDLRAKNFSKLWATKEELTIIATEYLKYYNSDIDFIKKVCDYSQKNKDIKNFKKRLKGQEVND